MAGWIRQATTGFASSEREEIGIKSEDWKETDISEKKEQKEGTGGDDGVEANPSSIFLDQRTYEDLGLHVS